LFRLETAVFLSSSRSLENGLWRAVDSLVSSQGRPWCPDEAGVFGPFYFSEARNPHLAALVICPLFMLVFWTPGTFISWDRRAFWFFPSFFDLFLLRSTLVGSLICFAIRFSRFLFSDLSCEDGVASKS